LRFILEIYSLQHEYLRDVGWIRSWSANSPVDREGVSIPWLNYPVIHFLDNRLNEEMSMFEYGSGASTIWYAQRTRQVLSCENDEVWFTKVEKMTATQPNVQVKLATEKQAYVQEILNYKQAFDVIIIDGRWRNQCAQNCLAALKPNGVVIFDNSERTPYRPALDFFETSGFKRLDFFGLAPLSHISTQTSVF